MPTNVSRNFCLFEIPVDHLMFSWLWPEVNNAIVIKSGRLSSRCPTLSQWLLPMAVWPPCTLSCQLRVCPWTCSNPWGCAPTSWSSLCPSSPCSSCTASPANNEELSHKRLPWYQPLGQVGRVANRVVGNDSFGRTAPCRHCRRHQRLLLKHKKKKTVIAGSHQQVSVGHLLVEVVHGPEEELRQLTRKVAKACHHRLVEGLAHLQGISSGSSVLWLSVFVLVFLSVWICQI